MDKGFLISAILSIIALGIAISYRLWYFIYPSWFVLDFAVDIIIYCISLTLIITAFILSCKRKYRTNRKKNYLLYVIIASGTLLIAGTKIYEHYYERKPSLLFASQVEDINGMWIDLKRDGTYILHYYSILGGEFYKGKYKIEGDHIMLSEKYPLGNKDNNYVANRLLLRGDTIYFHLNDNEQYNYTYYMTIKNKKS